MIGQPALPTLENSKPTFNPNPTGKGYDLIVADPPWDFTVWSIDPNDKKNRHVSLRYPIMKAKDIAALPVKGIAAKNCVLLIWSTWPALPDAMDVIKAWGFEYKTLAFIWVKQTSTGKIHKGMSYSGTMANSEPCLLAIKGKMPRTSKSQGQVIIEKIRGHSQKPKQFYERTDRIWPGTRRIEIFASEWSSRLASEKGFEAAYGFEVDGKDLRDTLPEIQRKTLKHYLNKLIP